MNLLDMKTVIVSYIISNAICMMVVLFLCIHNRRRFDGLGFWLADFVMQFLALLLVVLRGFIPDWMSMTVSNALIIGGTVFLYAGLERFIGKRSSQIHNILLLAVFIPSHAYFVVHPNLGIRNLIFSLGLLAICAQCAWLMLRRVDLELYSLTKGIGMLFVTYCLVSLARVFLALTIPLDEDFFKTNMYDTSLIMLYQMLFIILTFNLFLMVNRRLIGNLEFDIAARKQAERILQQRTHDLGERVKELNCLYGVAELANKPLLSLDEILQGIVDLIPSAWQYPDLTCARLTLNGQTFATSNFNETSWKQTSGIVLRGERAGTLDIYYVQEMPLCDDEPFLKEERLLLDTLAKRVGEIAERKQAEDALRESETNLNSLIENTDGSIWAIDPHYRLIVGNKEFHRNTSAATGNRLYKGESVLGSAIPSEINAEWQGYYDRALRGEAFSVETMTRFRSIPRQIEYRFSPIYNAAGEIQGVTVYGRDITERKQAEMALRKSDERYQAFISQSFEAIYRTEFDRPIDISLPVETQIDLIYENAYMAESNQALADMYNMPSVEAMIGMRLLNMHGGRDNPINRAAFRKFIENGCKSVNNETMERDAFGNPMWFVNNTIGIVESGYLVRMWGTSINVTERKQDEAVFQLRLKLFEFSSSHSLGELMQKTLDEICLIVNSPIGFYHFVEADQQTLSLQAWSTRTLDEFCHAEGKDLHYPIDRAGVWTDCIREQKPVIHNDYSALPHRKGLPPGHAAIIRELVVPILREGRVVSILGVGNKPADYNERDVHLVSYIADVVWEIVARKRAEETLQQLSRAVEQSPASIVITDTNGRIEYVNPRFTEVTGYNAEDAIGQNPRILKTGMTPMETYRDLWNTITAGRDWQGEFVNRKKNGEIYYELASISPILDAHGSITHYVAVKENITERKESQLQLRTMNDQLAEQVQENLKLQEILREQTLRDPLTGLYNRRYLDETMKREIARAEREKYPLSFLMIDIDHFKDLNDTYGHSAGDAVLVALGDLFHTRIRQGDIVCRYGGEEFIVIMPQADVEDAKRRAEEIRRDFGDLYINCDGIELSATISIGIALYPQHGNDTDTVIKAADAALYKAKQSGRNCVHVVESGQKLNFWHK